MNKVPLKSLICRLSDIRVDGDPEDVLVSRAGYREADSGNDGIFADIEEYLEYNQWGRSGDMPCAAEARTILTDASGVWRNAKCVLRSPDPRRTLGEVLRFIHGDPADSISMIGVTGTNGKTTTVRLLGWIGSQLFPRAGSLGTLGLEVNGEMWSGGSYTTPLSPELFGILNRLRDGKVEMLAMEVSSHALELGRVSGIRFDSAVTTRITRDHLDFHGSLEKYIAAKRRLFEQLDSQAVAVVSEDCPVAREFRARTNAGVLGYSALGRAGADLAARQISVSPNGVQFVLQSKGREYPVSTRLVGRFQVDNILAALAVVVGNGWNLEKALRAVATFPTVPGRMESVVLPNGATAVVDYAHNPDGLRNLLENARALNPGRILLVFGCGGDRDKGKRPLMGEIGYRGADEVWLTSDNPRTEDPQGILRDIVAGVPKSAKARIIVDRSEAIRDAYRHSDYGDLIVVAGKGHEDYQIIGREKLPYSDLGVLQSL